MRYRKLDFMGYPGYRISERGVVESRWEKRSVVGFQGVKVYLGERWKPRKVRVKDSGYRYVVLYNREGKKTFKISRLVLTAFVGPCPDGKECCHWDGNKLNDVLSNLRWGTRLDNIADGARHGVRNR